MILIQNILYKTDNGECRSKVCRVNTIKHMAKPETKITKMLFMSLVKHIENIERNQI